MYTEILVSKPKTAIQRPARWDSPLDSDMTESMVSGLLEIAPFSQMDPGLFTRKVPLRGLLKNDCRIHTFEKGDIIIREGDYGNSAFLVLDGEAIVSLKSLPAEVLGRHKHKPKGWFKALAQLWENSSAPESRNYGQGHSEQVSSRGDSARTRVFLQDIPRVLDMDRTARIATGEIFGEISALTRTPRTATVVAGQKSVVLEIRWQGFRDLLKRDNQLRTHVDALYRKNSLKSHLREVDLLKGLSTDQLQVLADATVFESYGSYEWNREFQSTRKEDIAARILHEPTIAKGGDYVNGLLLIRNGFARLSREHGDGHQTIAYLGKGESFGLREITHNWRTQEQRPWMLSLRAVGYVDILRLPTDIVEQMVLPTIPESQWPPPLAPKVRLTNGQNQRREAREKSMDTGLLEFLVGNRYINGAQAMMIDLDRCTRCDDCVRACAAAHNNNPRFVRDGAKHDHWMIANACMHCLDPVCMIGCPTGAIGRDADSGAVTINDQTCIGCSTCANSCPYSNIKMVNITGPSGKPMVDQETDQPIQKATKCDLCVEQLGGPACQRACPHDALVRIDLSTPNDVIGWSNR